MGPSILSLGKWFAEHYAMNSDDEFPWDVANEWVGDHEWGMTTIAGLRQGPRSTNDNGCDNGHDEDSDNDYMLCLNGIQVDRNKYVSIQ